MLISEMVCRQKVHQISVSEQIKETLFYKQIYFYLQKLQKLFKF